MEKARLKYKANEGLLLEGMAYTVGGIQINSVQADQGTSDRPRLRNTGMYYVTVTMLVDEVECS